VQKAVHAGLRAGISTTEVDVDFILAAHRALGLKPLFAAVQFGEATAYPHGVPHPQVLADGDMVLVDMGGTLQGYCSDITRTYVFGTPTPRQRQLWELEKTFVYCSEGSPEGFDPAPIPPARPSTPRAHAVYNRLVEFKNGTTEIEPGLAESWDRVRRRLEYTFHLRKGVKFHTTDFFTPTRDFNADDVIFSFERQGKADNPWQQYTRASTWEYYNSCRCRS
jgi:ABC-type transport system substrate-binding protein